MSRKKFIIALISIIVIVNLALIVPRLLKYNGMILEDIGEYKGYEYAYGGSSAYGLFRKSIDSTDYEKISKYAPLKDKFVFFQEDEIVYSTRAYSIVRMDLKTLEKSVFKSDEMSLLVIGINRKYIITEDVDNDSAITIFDIDTFEVLEVMDINPKNPEVNEKIFRFVDSKSNEAYEYHFESGQLKKIV